MSIEVRCNNCSKEMSVERYDIDGYGNITVDVEMCEGCATEEYERGKEDGEQEGQDNDG